MLKAVLFDMDGVIVDTEPLHRKAYYTMFNEFDLEISEELYHSFTGQSTKNICKRICNEFNLKHDPLNLELSKRQHFNDLFDTDESLQLLDGVLDLIKDYHHHGLTLVLASSATLGTINRVFKRFDLDQYFIAKLSGADLKVSKPHPEIFLKAAQTASERPENCMVIEDSTNGIQAAKSAGIYCVGYDSSHSKDQDYSKADLVISDFKDILYHKVKAFI